MELVRGYMILAFYANYPFAFLDFLVLIYEVPKRWIDMSLVDSERKHVKSYYDLLYTECGLCAPTVQRVRDCYVHRMQYNVNLIDALTDIDIDDVMVAVKYFELNIDVIDVSNKITDTIVWLRKFGKLYGYYEHSEKRNVRYKPGG